MTTIKNILFVALAPLIFAIGALTANGAPGDLYEADYNSGKIYKFAPDGTQSTFATGLIGPRGLAFDSAGNLFAGDYLGHTIYKFAPDGTRSTFANIEFPQGLTCDRAGNLFVAAYTNGAIYKFAPDGTRSTFVSGLVGPIGLAFDSVGNLFEADNSPTGATINKFAPDGYAEHFRPCTKFFSYWAGL